MPPRALVAATLLALLAGCASLREPGSEPPVVPRAVPHMALPASVGALPEEVFGKAAWGQRGDFLLGGQRVRYERGAERLSLFEPLGTTRTPLRYTWATPAGDSVAGCAGWATEPTANSQLVAAKPWVLSCRWSGVSDATLQITEGEMHRGRLSREGAYRRGELTLGLRSVHLLAGNPQPQATAVGYEMLHEGQVVASLDLSHGQPRLRRPDPATPLGRAVTEAALVLALVSEPPG